MIKDRTQFSTALMIGAAFNLSAQNEGEDVVRNSMDIYKSADAVNLTIDGKSEEAFWNHPSNVWHDITRVAVNAVGEAPPDPKGYSARFKAVYDDTYLYVLVEVTDATAIYFDGKNGLTDYDNVELFFGATGEPLAYGERDALHNSQLRMYPGMEDTKYANYASGGGYVASFFSKDDDVSLLSGFEYASDCSATGYTMEAIIPWEVVIPEENAGNIAEGKKILFDINPANVNVERVDPTIGGRETILSWSTPTFDAWRYNCWMGDMNFKGDLSSGIEKIEAGKMSYVMDNGALTLNGVANGTPVTIYDLQGRTVKTIAFDGEMIDLSAFADGIYVVKANGNTLKIVK